MTSTRDMPLVERVDAALEEIVRRVTRYAGLSDEPVPYMNRDSGDRTPAPSEQDEEPVNPLRHWRWE